MQKRVFFASNEIKSLLKKAERWGHHLRLLVNHRNVSIDAFRSLVNYTKSLSDHRNAMVVQSSLQLDT